MEHILCPIYENARRNPNRIAVITDEGLLSYAKLNRAVNSLYHVLTKVGIKPLQRVAFIAGPHLSTLLLLFALFRKNATAIPLSYRIPKEQIATLIKMLDVSHSLNPLTLEWNAKPTFCAEPFLSIHSPTTFLMTSGSSGKPKAAALSFANHYYNALGALGSLELEESSRWLLSLPLFHVSGIGICFRSFLKGSTVVLSKYPLGEAISHFQISHLSLVPTQLRCLMAENKMPMPSLKCILLGGAPIPPDLIQKAARSKLPIFTTYGMTEMGSMITLSKTNLGGVLPFREVKIDEKGEIHVRGKTLFSGYFDPLHKKVQPLEEGFFSTKDLGRWTSDGNLEVIGRLDRQFISGGENIQPEEIEKALCAIEGIMQASVLPIDDKKFGQRPVAFIADETGSHTLSSIRKALDSTLDRFKHPVAIFPYPESCGIKPNLTELKQIANRHFQLTIQL